MSRNRGLAIAALVLAGLLLAPSAARAQKKNLAFGTSAAASSHYAYSVGAAKAINTLVPELSVSVVETGGTVDNLRRMLKGQIDFGIATTDQAYLAWKGEANYKDAAFPEFRLIWVYTVSAVYQVVREDTGIKSNYDLTGKKFNPGTRGSGQEKMTELVLGGLGIKPDYVRGSTSDAVDAMKDKRIVGYSKSGAGFALDPSTMDIATQTPIRILPFTAEEMTKITKRFPHSVWVKVPARAVLGMESFWTPAVVAGVGASKAMPADIVYKITKAITEGREYQAAVFKGVPENIPEATIAQALSPLHAGAVRYYRELGLKIPDALVPPEAR